MPYVTVIMQRCPWCLGYTPVERMNKCIRCGQFTCMKCGYHSRKYGVFCPKCGQTFSPRQRAIMRAEHRKNRAMWQGGWAIVACGVLCWFLLGRVPEGALADAVVLTLRLATFGAGCAVMALGIALFNKAGKGIPSYDAAPLPAV